MQCNTKYSAKEERTVPQFFVTYSDSLHLIQGPAGVYVEEGGVFKLLHCTLYQSPYGTSNHLGRTNLVMDEK